MTRTAVDDSAGVSRHNKPKPAPSRTALRLPRWSELRPLLRPRPLQLDPTQRRLSRALTIADLRTAAKRRTPQAVFDYTDGAAETETSLRRAREAFARVEFRPRVLRDVTVVDPTTTVLGRPSALPLALAPTGFTRMMHHQGERAVVRVADRAGIPYALSTLGTTSIEEVAAAAPAARKWFQLYVWRDRGAGKELVERAQAAGYEALMLTVDVPVAGARLRDVRNGLTIPPSLTLGTVLDAATHPWWWCNLLTTEPLVFASLTSWEGTVAELINSMFDPSLTPRDLSWLRESWSGPLIVKASSMSMTPAWWWTWARTRWWCPTTVAASSTAPRPHWRCSRRWSTRSAIVPRCWSTAGCKAAPTWWPRSPWAPGPAWSAGPTCMG
jgi:L-lactate dehydrogenase (cytochrome)